MPRLVHEDKQTLGVIDFYQGIDHLLKVYVLELPDRDNKFQVSRIPAGTYKCVLRWSKKYGWHFHVLDVESRTLILIHFGNYYRDTLGCLLVGNNIYDIDKDGYRDVTSSRKTMKRILDLPGNEFDLTIIDVE
jgi:hypothetical protein